MALYSLVFSTNFLRSDKKAPLSTAQVLGYLSCSSLLTLLVARLEGPDGAVKGFGGLKFIAIILWIVGTASAGAFGGYVLPVSRTKSWISNARLTKSRVRATFV